MPAKTIRKAKWADQPNFVDKPYVITFDTYLGNNKSATNIIKFIIRIYITIYY